MVVRVLGISAWRVLHLNLFSVQRATMVIFSAFHQICSNSGDNVMLRLGKLKEWNRGQCWGWAETAQSPTQSRIMSVALTKVCLLNLGPLLNIHFKGLCRRLRALSELFFWGMHNWNPFSVVLWQCIWCSCMFDSVNTLADTCVEQYSLLGK
jgi:hypothetical protein